VDTSNMTKYFKAAQPYNAVYIRDAQYTGTILRIVQYWQF